MMRKLLIGGFILIVAFGGALLAINLLLPGDSLTADRPALKEAPPLSPAKRTSQVIAPVAVSLDAIREKLETSAPREPLRQAGQSAVRPARPGKYQLHHRPRSPGRYAAIAGAGDRGAVRRHDPRPGQTVRRRGRRRGQARRPARRRHRQPAQTQSRPYHGQYRPAGEAARRRHRYVQARTHAGLAHRAEPERPGGYRQQRAERRPA